MTYNKRQIGSRYEKLAGNFLERAGYRILEYNFRSRMGEIDIVALEGGFLVFVEVKYRRGKDAGMPWEAVDLRKQVRICRTADYYRVLHCRWETVPVRFDTVCVLAGEIRVFRNAFDYIPPGWKG